jgi:Zinc finger, C3HC4 type (RING finger)
VSLFVMSRKSAPFSFAAAGAPSWNLEEIDDETAWLRAVPPTADGQPDPQLGVLLQRLDRQLRCELCRDIFKIPTKIDTCGHTFCSECVRAHLQVQQTKNRVRDCPACRVPLNPGTGVSCFENFLQPNRDLHKIVDTFQSLRTPLLEALRAAGTSSAAVAVAASATAAAATDSSDPPDPLTANTNRRGRGRRKRDEDYDNNDDERNLFNGMTASKKPKAESPIRKALPRKKLPIKFRTMGSKELKQLCREMGVLDGGGVVEMRNRLDRFRTYWNARCQDESESEIRQGFVRTERELAAAAQQDSARSESRDDSNLLQKLIERRNDDDFEGPDSSGDPTFDQMWHGGFAFLKESLKERKAKEKALKEKLEADRIASAATAAEAAGAPSTLESPAVSQSSNQRSPREDPAEQNQQEPTLSTDAGLLDVDPAAAGGTSALEGVFSDSRPSVAHADEGAANSPTLPFPDSSIDVAATLPLPGYESPVADANGSHQVAPPVQDQNADRAEVADENPADAVRSPTSAARSVGPTLSASSTANRAERAPTNASPTVHLPSMFVDLTDVVEATGSDENRHPDRSSAGSTTADATGRTTRARSSRKTKDDTQSSCSAKTGAGSSWQCPRCTLINTDSRKMQCYLCELVYLSLEYDQWLRKAQNDC